MALRPTLEHARARAYRAPGGPWDRESLDAIMRPTRRIAVVEGSVRLDGRALEALVAELAGRLRAAGVRRRDVVCWQLPNSIAAVALYRACWRLGAVAAPLHHRLGPAETDAAVAQVAPAVILAAAGLPAAELDGGRTLGAGPAHEAVAAALPAGGGAPVGREHGAARAADLAVALFTSGSTGTPKAALHTHRGLGYKATAMAQVHGLRPGEAVLAPAPLAHVSGLLNGVLITAVNEGACVLLPSWDAEEGVRLIEAERVAFMGAPPVFFTQMESTPGFAPARVASLRLISTGGASVSPAFVESTAVSFACRVKRTYGSTEAPTVATSGPGDSAAHAANFDGRAIGDAEIEVHDPDNGRRVAPGETGELWLRGPELFVGYVDADQSAAVTAPGGWYRSGDLGAVDEAGWLRVSGRRSDVIIRAGENISASEVEAALEEHPAVRQAVAVAAPDPAVGERVAAFVVSSEPFDLDRCRAWFLERGMTRFKTPEIVIQLEELPALAAGKPDRARLRAMAAERSESSSPSSP